MPDLALIFGSDLSVGPTGDLNLADGPTLTEQRVLRRLLTNSGDYIWQLRYGAGLGQFVGQPGASAAMQAVASVQMLLESAVARNPEPVINAEGAANNTVLLTILYCDAATGQSNNLSFSI